MTFSRTAVDVSMLIMEHEQGRDGFFFFFYFFFLVYEVMYKRDFSKRNDLYVSLTSIPVSDHLDVLLASASSLNVCYYLGIHLSTVQIHKLTSN